MNTNPRSSRRRGARAGATATLIGAALLLAACGSSGGSSGAAAPAVTARPGAVGVATTDLGKVLTDGNGRTLYMLTADQAGASSCSGSCVAAWPVVAPTTGHDGSVTATLGSFTRTDGSTQLTVDGLPAYTYAADSSAGATNGQGVMSFGGTWWVLGLDGKPVTAAPSSTPAGGRY